MKSEEQQQVQEGAASAPEAFPLDEAAKSMIRELEQQQQQQQQALQVALNTVLQYFARQHNLQGKWTLAANKEELVKQAE